MQQAAEALGGIAREVTLTPTQPERLADTLTRDAVENGCDLVAAAGGDGTVNEVIQGLVGSDATLLVLPGGTANVMARETGLPLSPVTSAKIAHELVSREVELGVVEFPNERRKRYFLLMLGAGVDAGAVYHLNVDLKRKVGVLAYAISALHQLVKRFRRLEARIGEESVECTLAIVSKSRLYGGQLVLMPNGHLLAPEIDVVCFRSGSPVVYAGYFASVITRTLKWFPGVHLRKVKTIDFVSADRSSVYVQTDGELVGALPATVRLGPEKIKVLLPSQYVGQY